MRRGAADLEGRRSVDAVMWAAGPLPALMSLSTQRCLDASTDAEPALMALSTRRCPDASTDAESALMALSTRRWVWFDKFKTRPLGGLTNFNGRGLI